MRCILLFLPFLLLAGCYDELPSQLGVVQIPSDYSTGYDSLLVSMAQEYYGKAWVKGAWIYKSTIIDELTYKGELSVFTRTYLEKSNVPVHVGLIHVEDNDNAYVFLIDPHYTTSILSDLAQSNLNGLVVAMESSSPPWPEQSLLELASDTSSTALYYLRRHLKDWCMQYDLDNPVYYCREDETYFFNCNTPGGYGRAMTYKCLRLEGAMILKVASLPIK